MSGSKYSVESRMGSVNLVVVVEAIRMLIAKKNDELQSFHLPSIIAVGAALGSFSPISRRNSLHALLSQL
jgi:hypothetical protein